MNKFELRRLDLIDLKKRIGFGAYREMSERTGIDPSYLSRCAYPEGKKGKKNIGDETVEALDAAYPRWRVRELSVMGFNADATITSEAGDKSYIEIKQHNDVRGAMGKGVFLSDQPGQITSWRVTMEWANKNIPSNTGNSNLRVVTGFGDSMRPMYNPGDPLLIDIGINNCSVDGIYFFRIGEEGFIKRLQRVPGKGIRALSENDKYEAWTITDDMDFEVFGRVLKVWSGTDF